MKTFIFEVDMGDIGTDVLALELRRVADIVFRLPYGVSTASGVVRPARENGEPLGMEGRWVLKREDT